MDTTRNLRRNLHTIRLFDGLFHSSDGSVDAVPESSLVSNGRKQQRYYYPKVQYETHARVMSSFVASIHNDVSRNHTTFWIMWFRKKQVHASGGSVFKSRYIMRQGWWCSPTRQVHASHTLFLFFFLFCTWDDELTSE